MTCKYVLLTKYDIFCCCLTYTLQRKWKVFSSFCCTLFFVFSSSSNGIHYLSHVTYWLATQKNVFFFLGTWNLELNQKKKKICYKSNSINRQYSRTRKTDRQFEKNIRIDCLTMISFIIEHVSIVFFLFGKLGISSIKKLRTHTSSSMMICN